jgi:hypothetical protein
VVAGADGYADGRNAEARDGQPLHMRVQIEPVLLLVLEVHLAWFVSTQLPFRVPYQQDMTRMREARLVLAQP